MEATREQKYAFFIKTAVHLLLQGKKAQAFITNESGDKVMGCAYRAADGCKCAVGLHIPDTLYAPEMEGTRISHLLSQYPALKHVIPDVGLAQDLQKIHDSYRPHEWPAQLEELASRYHFNMAPVITELLRSTGVEALRTEVARGTHLRQIIDTLVRALEAPVLLGLRVRKLQALAFVTRTELQELER
jgi:hypothetical protein